MVGLLVPDASHPTGYTTFPVTVGPDSSFSVAGVPFGSYFIEIDQTSTRQNAVPNSNGDTQVAVVERTLYEASTSTPDLSIVVSKRPDVQTLDFASDTTRVQINLTGLSPFVAGDVFRMGSSQNALNAAFTSSDFSPRIAAGSTSVSTSLFWEPEAFGVFPDASKGDSEYFWQRGTQALASDATLSVTKSFVKLTGFTVVAGAANTLTATLAAPPLTGSFTADLRLSQFAALASSVHPGATPSANTTFPPDVAIDSVAHSLTFPDQPINQLPGRFLTFFDSELQGVNLEAPETFFQEVALTTTTLATDVDYGNIAHARFFDSLWQESAQIFYSWDVPLPVGGAGSAIIPSGGIYRAFIPRALLPNPVVPEIGPPTAPLINGADAFAFQSGVGTQPVISWSAPSLGAATRYKLLIASSKQFNSGELAQLSVVLYDQISFRVPGDFLESGNFYYSAITASRSPDRLDDPILRLGSPTYEVDALVGFFQP